MSVKKILSMSFAFMIVFSLFASCDLMKEDEPNDPQIRIQVEPENETRYFIIGIAVKDENDQINFLNSTDWIIASGGFSDYVSVEEGSYNFAFDTNADHQEVLILVHSDTKDPINFELKNNRKYTIIFGADGGIYLPDFPDLY